MSAVFFIPAVFSRVASELTALRSAGVPYVLVPGISSALVSATTLFLPPCSPLCLFSLPFDCSLHLLASSVSPLAYPFFCLILVSHVVTINGVPSCMDLRYPRTNHHNVDAMCGLEAAAALFPALPMQTLAQAYHHRAPLQAVTSTVLPSHCALFTACYNLGCTPSHNALSLLLQAAPLAAGFPLTDLQLSQHFAVVSAHDPEAVDWSVQATVLLPLYLCLQNIFGSMRGRASGVTAGH